MLETYYGNRPQVVRKNGKYRVKRSGGSDDMLVEAVYPIGREERVLLTTDQHDDLVKRVNAVKEQANGVAGGPFYINEFRQVLVPDSSGEYYLAGAYDRNLIFEFEGRQIGPVPPSTLGAGDEWPCLPVGIPYTLAAGGQDIYFDVEFNRRIRRVSLSKTCGDMAALVLAERLAEVKGRSGGRIYINEARHFFAPVDNGTRYVYLGPLDDEGWFPPQDQDIEANPA